jgi:predicted TIM-barrel fold metal-dependent hydrolase
MRDGFLALDGDRHVMEPADIWERYMEPRYKGRVELSADHRVQTVDGKPVIKRPVDGVVTPKSSTYLNTYADGLANNFDAPSNLRAMDREGVDVAVLFPTIGLQSIWADHVEPEVAAAISRAYNNWIHEFCSVNPERQKGVMLLPIQDAELARTELRRAHNELELTVALVRPNPLRGRNLASPDYFPIYELAAELGVVVGVHESALCAPSGRIGPLQRVRPARSLPSAGADARLPQFLRRRSVGALPRTASSIPRIRHGLAAFLAGADG